MSLGLGAVVARLVTALSTCGLYQGYHSERQPLFCPPLSRMSLETLERAHVWPPGSDHTAAACTSAGVL
uniref:Secreted protein n=1 Tax=Knipowitschia caucasica TaxID=637954 RepID=A0AAV2K8N9_KNICA